MELRMKMQYDHLLYERRINRKEIKNRESTYKRLLKVHGMLTGTKIINPEVITSMVMVDGETELIAEFELVDIKTYIMIFNPFDILAETLIEELIQS